MGQGQWKIVDLTGTKNGSNTVFTIPDTPDLQTLLIVFNTSNFIARRFSAGDSWNTPSAARRSRSGLRRTRPINCGLIMTLLKDKKYKSKRVQKYKRFGLFYSFTFVLFYLASVADAQLIRRETIQAGIIFCEDAGATDTYTCPTPIPALAAYDSKILTIFRPNTNNTGAASLNISGLGAVTITAFDGTTLANNALVAG